MAKLPILSSEKIIRALRKKGFRFAPKRGKGSHIALVGADSEGRNRLVIIPKRKDVPIGTLQSILDLARPKQRRISGTALIFAPEELRIHRRCAWR